MNKKAENFKKYLDEKEIKAFTVDEIKDDQFQTVVFRSAADINGIFGKRSLRMVGNHS